MESILNDVGLEFTEEGRSSGYFSGFPCDKFYANLGNFKFFCKEGEIYPNTFNFRILIEGFTECEVNILAVPQEKLYETFYHTVLFAKELKSHGFVYDKSARIRHYIIEEFRSAGLDAELYRTSHTRGQSYAIRKQRSLRFGKVSAVVSTKLLNDSNQNLIAPLIRILKSYL